MTQEDKELLLKDLCARLPYGVKVLYWHPTSGGAERRIGELVNVDLRLNCAQLLFRIDEYYFESDSVNTSKPYLRSMSSMTEEEYAELRKMTITSPNLETAVTLFWDHHYDEAPNWRNDWTYCALPKVLDWLNKNMFDYRGLIPMGLALEAPEGMYKS